MSESGTPGHPTGIRILLAYDGSRAAVEAIVPAAELFPQARVLVTHIWNPAFDNERLWHRLMAETGTVGEPPVRRITVPSPHGLHGDRAIAHALRDLARERQAELVVVGSRGRGGRARDPARQHGPRHHAPRPSAGPGRSCPLVGGRAHPGRPDRTIRRAGLAEPRRVLAPGLAFRPAGARRLW